MQSLAGCEYFPYVFSAFNGNLVMELITCADDKAVKGSSMQRENKLTSANLNIICFSLVSASKSYKTIYEKPKVSIQIIKNAKRNSYKRTNEHWYSRPLWPSSRGLRRSTKPKPNTHQLVKNESRYENQTCINWRRAKTDIKKKKT